MSSTKIESARLVALAEGLLRDERAVEVEGVRELAEGVLELHRPEPQDPEVVHDHALRPFGAYVSGCPRCEAIRSGAARPVEGWQARRRRLDDERAEEIRRHSASGECARTCGPVCVKFDW